MIGEVPSVGSHGFEFLGFSLSEYAYENCGFIE